MYREPDPDDSDDEPSTNDTIDCEACHYKILHRNIKRHRESQTHAHCRVVKARRDQEAVEQARRDQEAVEQARRDQEAVEQARRDQATSDKARSWLGAVDAYMAAEERARRAQERADAQMAHELSEQQGSGGASGSGSISSLCTCAVCRKVNVHMHT